MDQSTEFSRPVGLTALRLLLAGIIAAHGWARLLADAVAPFGGFLDGQGFPFGIVIAWGVTIVEIAGSFLLAAGTRFTSLLCAVFGLIYLMGIILVHASEGWFVVGLGRNGMEYSVLLIASLMLVGVNHLPVEWRVRLGFAVKDTDN